MQRIPAVFVIVPYRGRTRRVRASAKRDAQPRGPLQGFRLIPLFLHRIPAVFVLPHIGAEPEGFALNFFKMVAIICIFEYNRTIEFRGTTILQAKIGRSFPLRHAAILIPPPKNATRSNGGGNKADSPLYTENRVDRSTCATKKQTLN